MRNVLGRITKIRVYLLWCMAVLLSAMFTTQIILADVQEINKSNFNNADHPQRKSIVNLLENKTASEKSQIKSAEISRYDFKGVYENTQYGVKVEIVSNPTSITINGQHGIELFARAWKGTQQLGFGADGSVEIERFRIFNPPILVDDPNGDIVREWTDSITKEVKQRKLREDPLEATRQVIAHNAKLVGIENAPIVIGRVGNTTSTFYPDANPESTSVDGYVYEGGFNRTWTDLVNAIGTSSGDADSSSRIVGLESSFDGNMWDELIRGVFLFLTSGLGSGSTVESATLSIYGSSKTDNGSYAPDINIYSSAPASNTALVTADFNKLGSTAFSSPISYSNWSIDGYNDFALNANGLANIVTTGVSKFGARNASYDVSGNSPTWPGIWIGTSLSAYLAEDGGAGTTRDPKLVVVHSEPTSSGTITRVVNGGDSILGASSLTMNFNITGSNLILFVSTLKQNSETITGVTWNGVPLTQVESVISYTTNNVQLWYLLAPAVGTYDLVTTASGSSGYIITDYALYSGVKQTGQLDGSTRVTGNTPITATITTGTDNTWAFLTAVQGGSAGTNATLIAAGDKPTYDNQGYGTIAPGTAFSMTVNLQPGNTGGVIMATFKDATPPATPTPTPIQTDITAPSGSISINSGASYTNTSTVTLSLSATDATGVTGYYVSTSSTIPSSSDSSWVSVSSTTSYSASVSYTLSSEDGSKTIYVWYKDAAGNVSSVASDFITLDTTAPTVSITSPTSDATYSTTSSTINLDGSASDSTSGVSSVAWSNSATGSSGTAIGTTSWSVSNINLSEGSNSITVTATDNAGNTATDSITVTYSIPQPSPMPTAPPVSCTDDYEPNEDFENAYGPMESGKNYEGKLCSSEDKDYFKFELENPNTIQLTLNVPSGNDYDLYLYDSSETEVSNSRTTEQTEIITHNAISTGIYYIQVFGYGGAYDEDLPYTLAGTWTASLVPTPTLTPIPTAVATPVPNPTGTPAATGVIIGSVTDAATSNPIARATVATDDGEYSATTNPAGRFSLSNIPTGNYTLTAAAAGYESTSQSVTVTAGAPIQANFSLNSLVSPSPTPGASILCEVYGFITDEDDHDLSEVNVTIKGTKDSRSALTDEDGYFEFTGLKAGKYTVTYEKEGYRKQSEDITLIEGESRDLGIIVMEQNIAGIIYGTVTDAENYPIESAKVKLKGKGSNAKVKEKYTTSEDGTYEFTDLDEGTYIIQAKKKGYNKAKERIKLSDGEDKGVDLVLEEK